MVTLKEFREIKKFKDVGLSIKKTADATNLSVAIVRKWWQVEEYDFIEYLSKKGNLVENYRQYIVNRITMTPQVSTKILLEDIQRDYPEIDVSRSTFFAYVKKVRNEIGIQKSEKRITTIRPNDEMGYEAQVDFGQYRMKNMYGHNIKVYFFVMILSYSRMKFVYFSSEPFTTKKAIEAHEYAFKYFGGRTESILYDQDRVFVVSENYGDIILTKYFEEYVKEKGFSVRVCRGADPQSKGKVERGVKMVKQDFLEKRIYYGIDRLNSECLLWLDNEENRRINWKIKQRPCDMFKDEIKHLIKTKEYTKFNTEYIMRVNGGCVEYNANFYELPYDFIAEEKEVRAVENGNFLEFYDAETNVFLCNHKIAKGVGQISKVNGKVNVVSSAEIAIREYFKNDATAMEYIENVKKYNFRHCYQFFARINNYISHYTDNELDNAFDYCNSTGDYHMGTLTGYLINRYGVKRFKEICSYHNDTQLKYYLDKAKGMKKNVNR